MSSLRRTLASRANGARSRGPSTPQGKERAAQNALRHGLLARCVVLKDESRDAFQAVMAHYVERLDPADDVEMALVEEMAAAYWRLRRLWALETRQFDNAIAAETSGDRIDRMTNAFSNLAAANQLGVMHRYETRLHMMYQRALNNLFLLRAERIPNEPSPTSEHGQTIADDPAPEISPDPAPETPPDPAVPPAPPIVAQTVLHAPPNCPTHAPIRPPTPLSAENKANIVLDDNRNLQ